MKLETVLKTEGSELPPLKMHQSRLLVTADGVFLERLSDILHSSAKFDLEALGLAGHTQFCRLKCGKINRTMHRSMLGFFKYAYELHGGEAALVLLHDPEQRQFRWYCPEQSVSAHWSFGRWVTSDYIAFQNPTLLPEGFVHFGDAHLHVGPVAPSATDVHDDQDGLHIIAGRINGIPEYHIDFVVDGQRFRVDPELIFEYPDCLPFERPPRSWCERIRIEKYIPYQSHSWSDNFTYGDDQWGSRNGGNA